MKRRRLLQTFAASSIALAGCLDGRSRTVPESVSETTRTTEPTRTTTTETTTTETTTDGGRTLSVDRIRTFSHAIRMNDLGRGPRGDVPAAENLSDRKREVVRTAIEGTYETDELPTWFVQFVDSTPMVREDATYYRLEHTLPTYTVTAKTVEESAVDGEIADFETYREAVTHDGRVTTGLVRIAAQEGITFVHVWPSLRDFLDRYDAVRYHDAVYDLAVAEDDPGPPYTVTAEEASLPEVAGKSVWNVEDAPEKLREIVRAAGGTEGLYPVDDPPEGLIENLDGHERAYLDGRFYTTYVEKRGPLPVELSASFPDATLADEAKIELALRNRHEGEIRVDSGPPAPFGILHYHPVGNAEDRRLLWTDAYEESGYVGTDGHEITRWNPIGLVTRVGQGESVAHAYEIEATDLEAGEYVIAGDVGVSPKNQDGGTFPYRVHFSVK